MVIVHNVISASTSVDFKYFDTHHLFGLETQGTYTFSIDDLEYREGERILNHTEAFEALREAYTTKQVVAKIGTDIFNEGVITNLSRAVQGSTNSNEVVISIRESKPVAEDGNLREVSRTIPVPHKLTSFSENFSFQRSGSDISYVRNVSLQYSQDISEQFLNNAYIFLKNTFFRNRPNFGYQTDGLSEKARFDQEFRPKISENYDLVNKSVSFTENFVGSDPQADSKYSRKLTYALRNTEKGFLEKEYSIEVIGLKTPIHQHALSGTKREIDRIIADEAAEFGDPVSIDKAVAKDSGKITTTMLFTTDSSINQAGSFTYSVTKSKNDSFLEYSVDMERKQKGKSVRRAYASVLDDWSTDTAIGKTKANLMFPETNTLTLYEKSRQTGFSPNDAGIKETVTYTTDPSFNTSGDDVLKQKIRVNQTNQVERIFRFIVPKDKERVQRRFPKEAGTLGQKTISVEIIKRKGADTDTAESEAFTRAESERPPSSTNNWLVEKTSSIDPFNGVITTNLVYNFFTP